MIVSLFFNLGNILYLVGYSIRDMLWLRILIVIASFCLMPYYVAGERILWQPVIWTTMFIAINVFQITILILERRPVFLNEKELQLYQTIFQSLKPREFAKLLAIAEWKDISAGEELLAQGKPVDELMLITSGRGTVELDNRKVADVNIGQFVGEMAFLTEERASARVFANITTSVLCWPAENLRRFLDESPILHVKIQSILGTDLAAKLRKDGRSQAHPSILYSSMQG